LKKSVLIGAFIFSCIAGTWFSSIFISPTIKKSFTSSQVDYDIDPFFDRFYHSAGGSKYLGPAISSVIDVNGIKYQFIENGLLGYHNSLGFFLESLGVQLGYHKTMYSGGAIDIYSGFYNLYEKLGGEMVFGEPITVPFFNQDMNRLEQHFENLGIFLSLDKESDDPRLLPYGVYSCDYGCRYTPDTAAIMLNIPEPFRSFVSQNEVEFTGQLLDTPFVANDGNTEAVFQNIVLYSNPSQPHEIMARPIVEALGIDQHPPTTAFDHPEIIFIPTFGDLGHNIPIVFYDYLSTHGGLGVSGNPLTELFQISNGQFRQCFENLCVEYISRGDNHTPYLTPLGDLYFEIMQRP
jgi:hypothetical protein